MLLGVEVLEGEVDLVKVGVMDNGTLVDRGDKDDGGILVDEEFDRWGNEEGFKITGNEIVCTNGILEISIDGFLSTS